MVTIPNKSIIKAHLKSPLKSAGKNPKKRVVQENPSGAWTREPVVWFFKKIIKKKKVCYKTLEKSETPVFFLPLYGKKPLQPLDFM
jgi:hypothetical protein